MALQKFEATPTLVNGHVAWRLCYTNPLTPQCGSTKATYPDISLPPNQPNQPFQFKIVNDNTGLNIQFANTNPLWIQQGSQPTGPGVNGQIVNIAGNSTKVLTFDDQNTLPSPTQPSPVVLKYQLNFTDGQGNPVTSIDPDITNGGKTLSTSYTTSIVVAVTTVIALLLIVAWFRSRAAKTMAKER